MRLKRCLSAIEFTTRRNHGRLSESVPSRSNIASLYLGMIRISPCPYSTACESLPAPDPIHRHSACPSGSAGTSVRFFHFAGRNLTSASAFLNRSNYGGKSGTRTSTLAFGRAYSSDPFVVAVLRPLTSRDNCVLRQSGSVEACRSLIFCSGQRHQTRAFF